MDIVLTIVMTTISGFAFLSYNEPRVYKKIYPFVLGVLFISCVASLSFFIALQYASSAFLPFIDNEKIDQAGVALASAQKVSTWCTFFPMGIAFVFIFFDWFSDQRLKNEKD